MPGVGEQARGRGLFQQPHHLLDRVAVTGDDEVEMLRKNSAGINLVSTLRDLSLEAFRDTQGLLAVEYHRRKHERSFRSQAGFPIVRLIRDRAARVSDQCRGPERL